MILLPARPSRLCETEIAIGGEKHLRLHRRLFDLIALVRHYSILLGPLSAACGQACTGDRPIVRHPWLFRLDARSGKLHYGRMGSNTSRNGN